MAIGRIPEPGTGIPESIIAAKGDLLTGTANDTPAVLTVGANGTTLVADSSENTGLKWATPSTGVTNAGANVAAEEGTSSTSYTDLTTAGPAVTLTTGTKALVIIGAYMYQSTSNKTSQMGFAISGSTSVAASNDQSFNKNHTSTTDIIAASNHFYVTGLTAGSNTFTAKYRAPGGGTSTFIWRYITVLDMGS